MLRRLTPMEVMSTVARVGATYPTNTEEYMALQIAAGVVGGLWMSGGLADALVDGRFPLPDTLRQAMEEGEGAMDPDIIRRDGGTPNGG